MAIAYFLRAWLHLVPLIPSVIITIFNLYHFLSNRTLRRAINNHVIILLLFFGLISELTAILWSIYYYLTGNALLFTPHFCLTWVFLDVSLLGLISIMMSWASIERHILVFHPHWLSTTTKCFFFHYLPLFLCILWPTTFYFMILIIIPCDVPFYYNTRDCGRYVCVLRNSWFALIDGITNYILPAFITAIFSVLLFVRVLYHRYHIHRRIHWRSYRKLAIQLLPIATLYIALQLPTMILYAAYSIGLSRTVAADYYSDSLFFMYWIILFTPFVSTFSLPDLKMKCRDVWLFWRKKRPIDLEILALTQSKTSSKPIIIRTSQ